MQHKSHIVATAFFATSLTMFSACGNDNSANADVEASTKDPTATGENTNNTFIDSRDGKTYKTVKINETIEQIENEFEELSEGKSLEKTYEGYEIDGILEIPKINLKYPIITITNDKTMKLSVTKFYGPNLNEYGNYSIAGHNNKDGTLFGKTQRLTIGDKLLLTDLTGRTIEYIIYDRLIIDPNDITITQTTEDNAREVTLITCTNGRKNRFVLKAKENKELKGEF